MAAHHATVATFVPTDVDTKIRGILWSESRDREVLRAMCDFALAAHGWDLSLVSRRTTEVGSSGPVSGHDGEGLSILAGAHGRFLALGDIEYTQKTGDAIDAELAREAAAFRAAIERPGMELDVLRLASSLTHNVGDLDQAISFWHSGDRMQPSRTRFGRLAHENRTPYEGTFQIAARCYRDAMAAEGHRHYPLRAVKALRRSQDLLLPLGPFFDDWGAIVAKDASLSPSERAEVIAALITGCHKVPNQQGYGRALAGFAEASPRAFEAACSTFPASLRKLLRDVRAAINIPRGSFEAAMRKKARKLTGSSP